MVFIKKSPCFLIPQKRNKQKTNILAGILTSLCVIWFGFDVMRSERLWCKDVLTSQGDMWIDHHVLVQTLKPTRVHWRVKVSCVLRYTPSRVIHNQPNKTRKYGCANRLSGRYFLDWWNLNYFIDVWSVFATDVRSGFNFGWFLRRVPLPWYWLLTVFTELTQWIFSTCHCIISMPRTFPSVLFEEVQVWRRHSVIKDLALTISVSVLLF